MPNQLELFLSTIPPITRGYLILSIVTSAAVYFELLRFVDLWLDFDDVFLRSQYWRLATTFLFFGPLGLDFALHMFFLVRYSKMLEEQTFFGRSADYLFMVLFGAASLLAVAAVPHFLLSWGHSSVPDFLSNSLAFMIVYVWARQNPDVHMSFLGLFHFTAPYFPWVLVAFSAVVGMNYMTDVLGIAVGHLYYFLEIVYPAMGGPRLLKTPQLLLALVGQENEHAHGA